MTPGQELLFPWFGLLGLDFRVVKYLRPKAAWRRVFCCPTAPRQLPSCLLTALEGAGAVRALSALQGACTLFLVDVGYSDVVGSFLQWLMSLVVSPVPFLPLIPDFLCLSLGLGHTQLQGPLAGLGSSCTCRVSDVPSAARLMADLGSQGRVQSSGYPC